MAEDQIKLPSTETHIPDPPRPIAPIEKNWPLLPSERTLLEKALIDELGDRSLEEPAPTSYADELSLFEKGLNGTNEPDLINVVEDGESWEEVGNSGGGWDMGDEGEAEDLGLVAAEIPVEGVSDAEYWVRNSPLAADHIAAGSFETAMQLLNRQVGAANFEPLKSRFLQIYQASQTFLEANPGLPPLELSLRRDIGKERSHSLPRLPWDYEKIKTVQMREALRLVTANRIEDAIVAFREILLTSLLLTSSSKAEADDITETVETLREYIVGLSVEVTRRSVDASTPDGVKRNLELAAYFTNFKFTPQHQGLAYQQAMTQFNKYKNTATAGVFASKFIALGIGKPDAVERVCTKFDWSNCQGKENCRAGPEKYP